MVKHVHSAATTSHGKRCSMTSGLQQKTDNPGVGEPKNWSEIIK